MPINCDSDPGRGAYPHVSANVMMGPRILAGHAPYIERFFSSRMASSGQGLSLRTGFACRLPSRRLPWQRISVLGTLFQRHASASPGSMHDDGHGH